MKKSSREFLHAARLADAVLFWPVLAFVFWGQLQRDVPAVLHGINDKFLHFSAYFILGAMAGGAIQQRGRVNWAVLGLIVLGAVVETPPDLCRPRPLGRTAGRQCRHPARVVRRSPPRAAGLR
jgi:hypothetical protein